MSARRAVRRFDPREGEPRIYSVTEILRALKDLLEGDYPDVVVQGEISDYRAVASSGHVYFRLKDAKAQLSVAFFGGAARAASLSLENGVAVQVQGRMTVYPQRGDMQLSATRVMPIGFGALQVRLEALKRKLQMEGIFAEERKRPLPRYPTRVALVTSASGAALRDMLRILRHRAPYLRVTLAPTRVQGEGAAEEIAKAIDLVNEWGEADVMIVGRGGGSLEDLWAFNEEPVVRAIFRSRIPVVSAVGHEVDSTLADLASDLRAATPTHAAQEVVTDRAEILETLADLSKHARERLRRELRAHQEKLRGIATHHALRHPERLVQDQMQRVDLARDRLARGLREWAVARGRRLDMLGERVRSHAPDRTVERARERLAGLVHRAERGLGERVSRLRAGLDARARLLESYDYRGVLRRGYALVWTGDGGSLVQRARSLRPDQEIQVEFEDSRARARITGLARPKEEEPA
ncbi:MAG TPA: exodeoxyribonuclease VII large subunit [Candidatus Eisenbacteria bacterium]